MRMVILIPARGSRGMDSYQKRKRLRRKIIPEKVGLRIQLFLFLLLAKTFDLSSDKSEKRRIARIKEKLANTTCFACREKGHAAKECPRMKTDDMPEKISARGSAVICYRYAVDHQYNNQRMLLTLCLST